MSEPLWNLIEESLECSLLKDRALHRSILNLSTIFTHNRNNLFTYVKNAKLRQAYLAYFLPLNFQKIKIILQQFPEIWEKEFPQTLFWIDYGCGPATASLAFLSELSKLPKKKPHVHIDLIDSELEMLKLAKTLIEKYAHALQLSVTTTMHRDLSSLEKKSKYDFSFAVNVLNELTDKESLDQEPLLKLWGKTSGSMLILEPSHRVSSQKLVRFRQRLLKQSCSDVHILGPCMHQDRCPVYQTKHWCHFSEPLKDPTLIALNRRIFNDSRHWLKFSYLLVKRGIPRKWDTKTFRIIGDLHPSGSHHLAIDLCQPKEKFIFRISRSALHKLRTKLVRGKVITFSKV